MSETQHRGGGGAFFTLLLVLGFVVMFWWVFAILLGIVVLGIAGWIVSCQLAERNKRLAAIIARADEQHAWVLADDERGTFGNYPPAV